jgi:hypothetical protein
MMSNAAKKDLSVAQPTSLVEKQAANVTQGQEVISSDVLIPRLLLMQGISPLVTSRKAQLGDLVRSTTGEKLGGPEKPVWLVPLKMVNSWINFEVVGNKPEFRGMEERNASNEQSPWEYEGTNQTGAKAKFQRRKAITLFALLPGDVAAYEAEIAKAASSGEVPDLNKTVLPVVLTFQSTSFKHAGKKIATFFNTVKVNAAKLAGKATIAPFYYQLPLMCREEKNNKGSYYVFDFGPTVPLKDAPAREEAARWSMILSNAKDVATDDSGELSAEATVSDSSDV